MAINLRSLLCVLAAVPVPVTGATAQRVLDLPMRTGPGADALAAGAVAMFWNPGALGIPSGRGEALVMDVRGPPATALDGFGLAGVARLDARTALGAGYQRVSIEDIEQTEDSPLPPGGARALEVAEHNVSLALLRAVGRGLSVGAGAQYTRTADLITDDNVVALTAGFLAGAALPTGARGRLGAGVRVEDAGTDWFAGAGLERGIGAGAEWMATVEYGASGSGRHEGVAHRAAVSAGWRESVRVSAGVAAEPGADGHTWNPVLGFGLRFSRYGLGVLREEMPNDLGAVYAFRIGLTF